MRNTEDIGQKHYPDINLGNRTAESSTKCSNCFKKKYVYPAQLVSKKYIVDKLYISISLDNCSVRIK